MLFVLHWLPFSHGNSHKSCCSDCVRISLSLSRSLCVRDYPIPTMTIKWRSEDQLVGVMFVISIGVSAYILCQHSFVKRMIDSWLLTDISQGLKQGLEKSCG